MIRRIPLIIASILGLLVAVRTMAQETADRRTGAPLPTFDMSADLVAGLRIRLADWDPVDLQRRLSQLDPRGALQLDIAAHPFVGLRDELLTNGVRELTVLVTLAGFPDDPIVLLLDGSHESAAAMTAKGIERAIGGPWQTVRFGDSILIGSPANLRRLSAEVLDPHESLAVASAEHAAASLQLFVAPSDWHRRAVRELMPALPPELGAGPSATLVDGMLWGSLGIDGDDEGSFSLVLQSTDAASAERLVAWLSEQGPRLVEQFFGRSTVESLAPFVALRPKAEGDRIVRATRWSAPEASAAIDAIAPWIGLISDDLITTRNLRNIKQLMLALHNFHTVFERFPGYGTANDAGEPLLSWRVRILPFLGHQELYARFRLDEPWDSEHNKGLIAEMPEVFAAAGSRFSRQEGMTNFRVPGGPASMFPDLVGLSFKDFTDGSSNTIGILEVDDDHAVVWTRPESFEIDSAQPLIGLGGHARDRWCFARGDGSVGFKGPDYPAEKLRALLTRNGGEAVQE